MTDDVFVFPASSAQQRLWFLDQWEPESAAYNVPIAMRLTGPFDLVAFERSLNAIVSRHEVLRTTFGMKDGQPIQLVAPESRLILKLLDLTTLPPADREADALQLANAEAHRPFDLSRGPLVRATALRLDRDEHVGPVDDSSHRVRRMVDERPLSRTRGGVQRLRFSNAGAAVAAAHPVRGLHDMAAGVAARIRARAPARVLEKAVEQSASRAAAADRSPTPGGIDLSRRASSGEVVSRAGEQAHGDRPAGTGDAVHGAPCVVSDIAVSIHGAGRHPRGVPDCGSESGGAGESDRVFREHTGSPNGPQGRPDVSRGAPSGARRHAWRLRASGSPVRKAGRGAASGAHVEPRAALPDGVRPPEHAAGCSGSSRAHGGFVRAHARNVEIRRQLVARRRPRRAEGSLHLQHGRVRCVHDRPHGDTLRDPARRHQRRSRPPSVGAATPQREGTPATSRRVERHDARVSPRRKRARCLRGSSDPHARRDRRRVWA